MVSCLQELAFGGTIWLHATNRWYVVCMIDQMAKTYVTICCLIITHRNEMIDQKSFRYHFLAYQFVQSPH